MNILELISNITNKDHLCPGTLPSLGADIIQSFGHIIEQYVYLLNFSENSITCFSSESSEKHTQYISPDKVDGFIRSYIPV